MSDLHSTELMDLKDNDKYARQIGSKALIMTDRKEALEYEHKRRLLTGQKQRMDALEDRVGSVEKKLSRALDILEQLATKVLDQ